MKLPLLYEQEVVVNVLRWAGNDWYTDAMRAFAEARIPEYRLAMDCSAHTFVFADIVERGTQKGELPEIPES